jgi:hypothetical protein
MNSGSAIVLVLSVGGARGCAAVEEVAEVIDEATYLPRGGVERRILAEPP